jgi:hypothetical protein
MYQPAHSPDFRSCKPDPAGLDRVDQDIAAGDQVDVRERRLLEQIVYREQDRIAELLADPVSLALTDEEAPQTIFTDVGFNRGGIVDVEQLWLGTGPRENNARPAIDPMLRSVAVCCGNRGIGVVLTGTLGDGASGLWAIKQTGGVTLVQDPKDVAFPEMPQTALKRMDPGHVSQLRDMPGLL